MKYFLFTTLLLGITAVHAQTATLDSKKIYASIPELVKIQDLIDKDRKEKEATINQKSQALKELEVTAVSLIEKDPKAKAAEEAKGKYEKLFVETNKLQKELSDKHNEYKNLLYKPYQDSINAAIKTVATRKKYMQVIDIQEVPLVYMDPASDMTEEVIKALK